MNKETKMFYVISLIVVSWLLGILLNSNIIQVEAEQTPIIILEAVEQVEAPTNKVEQTVKYIDNPTQLQIQVFLDHIGEGGNWDKWQKIIEKESKWDVNSKAPTYWSICDRKVTYTLWGYTQAPTTYIELRDYANGRIWQATCEELGATTLRTGTSHGLTHILAITWESTKCEGNPNNWHDELRCAKKIKDTQGWRAWSYIN